MKKLILTLSFAAISLQAALIVDTSPPNLNATDIVNSSLAASFILGNPAAVTGINFWYQAQFQTDLASVAYAFYNDSSGALGSVIASGVATPTTSLDTTAFLAQLTIASVALGAGSFWLELHSGASLTDNTGFNIWWSATDSTGPHLALQNGTPITVAGFEQYAFQLDGAGGGGGSPTPEPSILLLTSCGFVGLARRFRRHPDIFRKLYGRLLTN